MKTLCVALLLLLVPSVSRAADISIGGVSLSIPSPHGFSPVTQLMTKLHDLQKHFVPPANEQFVAFIPESDVPAALRDEIPDLPRRFTVQTSKSLIDRSVSHADFTELKNVVASQIDDLMKRVEKELPGLMKQVNDGLKGTSDVDPAFSVSQMVPLSIHEDTDRTLAYSALVKYDMKDQHGNPAPFVAVATTTLVHVKGTILFLASYAEESGLEWNKKASRQWAHAVIAANPSDLQATLNEALPSALSGIDWGGVGTKAAGGAAIGAIVGLISWARRRGKAGQPPAPPAGSQHG